MAPSKPLVVVCDSLKPMTGLSMTEVVNGHMIRALRDRTEVEWPTSGKALIDALKKRPLAVLVTDPAVLKMTRPPSPHAALFDWTRSGGNLILCGQFSNSTRMDELDRMFEGWGLDWKRGSYHRTDFSLAPGFAQTPGLPRKYNAKTLHVRVPPAARVYIPADGAHTQSMVFAPTQADNSEAAVARDKCGQGTVSWIGDVNGEEKSTPIALWLAGLPLEGPPKESVLHLRPPERTVAIGRGGAPFAWHLLDVGPGVETRSIIQLSEPPAEGDTGRPPKYARGAVLTCPIAVHDNRLLMDELARVGIADHGSGMVLQGEFLSAVLYEVAVPAKDRVRWCAGCGKWERMNDSRYLGCSGCKARFYCSTTCQSRDWRVNHKSICNLLKQGKEMEVEALRVASQPAHRA